MASLKLGYGFPSIKFRLWFSQVLNLGYVFKWLSLVLTRPKKKRNAMLALSLCPLPMLYVYVNFVSMDCNRFVVTATREMWRIFFCRKRRDDEELEIVEEWLASSYSHERTPIHTSILTGKKHVEELLEGHKVWARQEFHIEKEFFLQACRNPP
jgi:hypothetical protein